MMGEGGAILFSIRPVYARAIMSGQKTIELRRIRPRIDEGARALVYSSSPDMQLLGGATVGKLLTAEPEALWASVRCCAGVSHRAYKDYFKGARVACGIELVNAWVFDVPIALADLRAAVRGFRPPQSYCFLPRETVRRITMRGTRSAVGGSPRAA